jgi:hypothetical protein
MKRPLSAAVIVVGTFVWLAVLFAVRPFDHLYGALDRAFGALPAWTQVEKMYRDPATQEVSRGDHPLESFRILNESWAGHATDARVMLMGNSQAYMTSLAPGEPPPTGPEKTYTDEIADHYRQAGWPKLFYRLSAGALSYQEMLWYGTYLAAKPEIRPQVLMIQLNYQNFANSGIRGGMLEMLSDGPFRENVEQLARSGRPESAAFAEALHQYETWQQPDASDAAAPGPSPGDRLEIAFRDRLSSIPGFDRRDALKQSFALMLIRVRTYILRVNASSRRSLGGPRIIASRAALEDLVELCGRSNIHVILFQAPTNPAVPLYGNSSDDRDYHDFCTSLASRPNVRILDLEHSIPASLWGMSLNVPDPLHLGREAHRQLARLMLSALETGP